MLHWIQRRIEILIKWSQNHLTKKQFIFLSSIIVGLSAGIAAILLKTFVHFIYTVATNEKLSDVKYLYLLLPLIGLLITVFIVQRFFKKQFRKGLPQIHYSIAKKSSILPIQQTYDQVVTSSFTVGLGGSVGLEAPIVITGAAIGSNYSRKYKLNYKERTLLLACGVSAGIGAAFNAPIAGVLFALEVLLLDISITAFTPLILAAASGALISKIILNDNILLSFRLKETFNYHNVPFYIVLGIIAGFVSVYHTRIFSKIEKLFHKSTGKLYWKAIISGVVLAGLIFIFPTLFGEGYQSIKYLAALQPDRVLTNSFLQKYILNDFIVLIVIGLLVFVKAIATALTIGGGGNGGNFAPSLFVGAYLGFFFSRLINSFSSINLPENNFTIVGMAGVLSGIYHAPLTAIFLIAEITGGYSLMIPLMIVASFAFAISKYLEPHAMDIKSFAEKGELIVEDRDKSILSTIPLSEVIKRDSLILQYNENLEELIEKVSHSQQHVFPVLSSNDQLLGLIWLDDVREIMFNSAYYKTVFVHDLMVKPPVLLNLNTSMDMVMKHFDELNQWILPVEENDKFIGFVTKSTIFSKYRENLKKIIIE